DEAPDAEQGDALPPTGSPPSSSSSGDDLNLMLGGASNAIQPDPFLGQFSSGEAEEAPIASVEGPPPSESFDAVARVIAFTDPTPMDPVMERRDADSPPATGSELEGAQEQELFPAATNGERSGVTPASSDGFPAIDLSAPPTSRVAPKPDDDEDEADD